MNNRFTRRPVVAAALVYALLALAIVGPSLVPGRTLSTADQLWLAPPWAASQPEGFTQPVNATSMDFPLAFHPWLSYARTELPSVPLWNPHVMAGRPFVGNGQSAVFSPFTLPALILPVGLAISVIAWAKLFVAGLGTFLLARSIRIEWVGALLAGVIYALGLAMITWLLILAPSSAWTVLPWLLLACDRVVARPRPGPIVALAAVTGIELAAGHPESSFHVLAAAGAFATFRLVQTSHARRAARREWLVTVGALVGGLLWGAALAAVVILPLGELLLQSTDIADRGARVHRFLDPEYARALAMPYWWGTGTGIWGGGGPQARFMYVGALPLMLGPVALVRPTTGRVLGAAAAGTCLMLVFGVSPAFDLANVVPGFGQVDNTRLIFVLGLCISLLAGAALEDLRLGRLSRRRRIAAISVATAIFAAPILATLGEWPGGSGLPAAVRAAWSWSLSRNDLAVSRLSSIVLWATFAGLGLCIMGLLIARRRPGRVLASLAVAVVTIDLLRFGLGYNPAIPEARATQPETGAIRYLKSRRPARFVGLGQVLPPNVAMTFGLYDARGYDFPVERRYAQLWQTAYPSLAFSLGVSVPYGIENLGPAGLRALTLLGVADVIVAPDAPPLRLPGLRVAYKGPDATVYANSHVLPRATMVHRVEVVHDADAAMEAVLRQDFDATRTVVSERPIEAIRDPDREASGRVSLLAVEPARIELRAATAHPGMLVLSDLHYPGWSVAVDGRPARLERVDYLLRGVIVPAGGHRVTFVYRPALWKAAVFISGIALIGLVIVALLSLRTGRDRQAPGSERSGEGAVVRRVEPVAERRN